MHRDWQHTVSQGCISTLPPRFPSRSGLRQEEMCPGVKSGISRAGCGALQEAGTGSGYSAAPSPEEEASGLCWARGTCCHHRPSQNSETGPGASRCGQVAAEGGQVAANMALPAPSLGGSHGA